MISKFFKIFTFLLIVSGMFLFFNFLEGQAAPKEFKVCEKGCAFEKIQEAVKLARDGDVIILGQGEYDQTVKVNKDITFKPSNSDHEISGSVGFSGPSLRLRQKTKVYISEVEKGAKGYYPDVSKEQAQKSDNDKVAFNTVQKKNDSSLETPLFDVSIQSKIEGKSSKEITITLIIFTVIALTILGYLVFGLIIKNRHKHAEGDDDLS